MMYQYLRTETEEEHAERLGVDETTALWGGEDETSELSRRLREEPQLAALVPKRAVRVTLVCSCGFTTCPVIGRYGLPRPVFHAEIEPIQSQCARDRRALELRA